MVNLVISQIHFLHEIKPELSRESVNFISISVNKFGDIYLLESNNHEIYRISDSGKILNINGGFGWQEGNFDTPVDINFSSGLNVMVADYNNHRVVRFDRELNYIASFPGENDYIKIAYPISLAASDFGEIFVLEKENAEVVKFDIQRTNVSRFGGAEFGRYALSYPIQIRLSEKGILNVLESSGRIVQFDRFGTPITIISPHENFKASCMVLLSNNKIILLSSKDNEILLYSSLFNQANQRKTTPTKNEELFTSSSDSSSLDSIHNKVSQYKWIPITIIGYDGKTSFVSAASNENLLYLLSKEGKIILCDIRNLNN
jgi:WD40 repeat protein